MATGQRAIFQKAPEENTLASWVGLWPLASEDSDKLYKDRDQKNKLDIKDADANKTHVIPYYINKALRDLKVKMPDSDTEYTAAEVFAEAAIEWEAVNERIKKEDNAQILKFWDVTEMIDDAIEVAKVVGAMTVDNRKEDSKWQAAEKRFQDYLKALHARASSLSGEEKKFVDHFINLRAEDKERTEKIEQVWFDNGKNLPNGKTKSVYFGRLVNDLLVTNFVEPPVNFFVKCPSPLLFRVLHVRPFFPTDNGSPGTTGQMTHGFTTYGLEDILEAVDAGEPANWTYDKVIRPDNIIFSGGLLQFNPENEKVAEKEAPFWKGVFVHELGHALQFRHAFVDAAEDLDECSYYMTNVQDETYVSFVKPDGRRYEGGKILQKQVTPSFYATAFSMKPHAEVYIKDNGEEFMPGQPASLVVDFGSIMQYTSTKPLVNMVSYIPGPKKDAVRDAIRGYNRPSYSDLCGLAKQYGYTGDKFAFKSKPTPACRFLFDSSHDNVRPGETLLFWRGVGHTGEQFHRLFAKQCYLLFNSMADQSKQVKEDIMTLYLQSKDNSYLSALWSVTTDIYKAYYKEEPKPKSVQELEPVVDYFKGVAEAMSKSAMQGVNVPQLNLPTAPTGTTEDFGKFNIPEYHKVATWVLQTMNSMPTELDDYKEVFVKAWTDDGMQKVFGQSPGIQDLVKDEGVKLKVVDVSKDSSERGLQAPLSMGGQASVRQKVEALYAEFPYVRPHIQSCICTLEKNMILTEADLQLLTSEQWAQLGIPIGMRNRLT